MNFRFLPIFRILSTLFTSVTLLLFVLLSFAFADEVTYFYDDAGRLVRAIKGSEGVVYEYDQVGNLLSISRGTTSPNPPTLQSINPDLLFIGSTTAVVITGQNLFTTKSITPDNPALAFKNVSITDTAIKADIAVSSGASPGPANIAVTTLYGSASIGVTLTSSRLSFDPPRLVLKPASTGVITASVIPSVGRDLAILLRSSDRSIVLSPESLTIPSGGTASFTVNALKEGLANINSGTPRTVVLVTTESGGPAPGEEVINRAGPVSVFIDSPPGNSSVASQPVSAKFDIPPTTNAIAMASVSGSTGADGAFNPTANTLRQLPADGVFNFTTVNIPTGVTVTFTKNAANTPVYILATGDVVIAGTIKVDGGSTSSTTGTAPGIGGPGGYDGGYGGGVNALGGKGMGPGGGGGGPSTSYRAGGGGGFGTAGGTYAANHGAGGPVYGNASLVPLIGGSGGGGGAGYSSSAEYGGGGGGGALLIASSASITVTGSISANGGNGYNYAGGGSGGAIRLIANTISGTGNISARGGNLGSTDNGGQGRIRLEASTNNFTPCTDPVYTYGQPGSAFLANAPVLRITSVASVSVPANPTGSYAQPDLLLPNTTTNPVTVNLSASYIPVGTSVTVSVIPQYGSTSSVTTSLSGVLESSTASASVNLSTTYSNVIMAQATFTLTASLYWDGEKIEKVRVAATMGKDSEAVYITESGKEIKAELMTKMMR